MKLTRRQLAKILLANDGSKRTDAVEAVARYLVSSNRTKEVELLARELEYLAARDGRLTAHVASARELSSEIKSSIEHFLLKLENAKSVTLSETIDPSLLGGVVITTPEREVDLSISGRLARMKGQL